MSVGYPFPDSEILDVDLLPAHQSHCDKTPRMRVFGIDCGTEFTGYGVVEMDHEARNPRLLHLVAGRESK